MRQLKEEEIVLVSYLLEQAHLTIEPGTLWVLPMDDGGMGSLAFAPISESRQFGRVAAECVFKDQDEVSISVALNLDQNGELLELDMFKADFSALKQWPSREHLQKLT